MLRSRARPPRPLRRRVLRALGVGALLALLVLVASTGWLASLGGRLHGERLRRAQRSPQWSGGAFRNLVPTELMPPGSLWRTLRMQLLGDEERVPRRRPPTQPRARGDYEAPPGLRATWLGHATVLIEIDGRRVLTDPLWSERGSPSTLVGPLRFFEPPLPLDDLPQLDAVVISHDHYDHLDMRTIQQLARRPQPFVVPLGIGAHLEAWGVPLRQIIELDWGERAEVADLRLHALPARHFSGRGVFDGRQTLWASWAIRGPRHRVFFSGDTGYLEVFRAIGAEHGPFDLTLIKAGAYAETWPDIHLTPEQALQVHGDVRGRLLLPIHWGTFNLALHAWNEPAERLAAAAARTGAALVVPQPGERVDVAAPPPLRPWWR